MPSKQSLLGILPFMGISIQNQVVFLFLFPENRYRKKEKNPLR